MDDKQSYFKVSELNLLLVLFFQKQFTTNPLGFFFARYYNVMLQCHTVLFYSSMVYPRNLYRQ